MPFPCAAELRALAWPALALGAALGLATPAGAHEPAPANPDPFREIETENIFGFTTGTDIGAEGETEVTAQTTGRFAKRGGYYRSFEHKLAIEHTPTQFMQVEFGLLGASHIIRSVPDLPDRDRSTFAGVAGEVRYLLIGRGPGSPIGLAASFEPTLAWIDDTSGDRLRRVETEFKLSADAELVPNRLFLAVNAIYEPEWVHPRFERTEREASAGASTALTYRVMPDVAVGGEVRYLRKYEGIGLRHFEGDALYLGPTLHVQLTKKAFLSLGWSTQVAGHEAVDRRERATAIASAIEAGEDPLAAVPARHGGLDLAHFDRHRARLKLGIEF
jgi:hypothetical protein